MIDKNSKVLIVVVNYNGFEHTCDCVESLLQQSMDNFHIYVVDNGSTDCSGSMIEDRYGEKIGFKAMPENLGVTGGNNAGIDYALKHKFDYVLFLNNDTIVDPVFLERLLETSQKYGSALVVPKIICFYDQQRLDHFVGSDINWKTAQPLDYVAYPLDKPELNNLSEIKVSSTCCLLAPISLFHKIGKMDEKYFMYYDDSDFTIRASRSGYRIIYDPLAIIYHKCNITTKTKQPSYFEYYLQNRNVFYFYRKLCDKRFLKYVFLAKCSGNIIVNLVHSILTRKKAKFLATKLVIRDVIFRRMGSPPQLTSGEIKKTRH